MLTSTPPVLAWDEGSGTLALSMDWAPSPSAPSPIQWNGHLDGTGTLSCRRAVLFNITGFNSGVLF